jgi:hypothetical protein
VIYIESSFFRVSVSLIFVVFRCGAAVFGSLWCKPQVTMANRESKNPEWGEVSIANVMLRWNLTEHYVAPPELWTFVLIWFLGFAPEATTHGCSAANRNYSPLIGKSPCKAIAVRRA